jgi:hypothetical protein
MRASIGDGTHTSQRHQSQVGVITITFAEAARAQAYEQIVIFRKGHGNVADISYFGGPVATRGHRAVGED